MVKVLSALISTLVTVSIASVVFVQGFSTSVISIGAPASAGGTPVGAGTFTPAHSINDPASAGCAPASAGSYTTINSSCIHCKK